MHERIIYSEARTHFCCLSNKMSFFCHIGALIGVSLGVLLIAQTLFLPSPIFVFGLPVLAFLFAGLFAAKRTGRVSTGTLAGLWSGFFSNIIIWAALFIALSTVYHADLVSAAQNSALGGDIRWSAPHLLGEIPSASNSRGENRMREMQEEEKA